MHHLLSDTEMYFNDLFASRVNKRRLKLAMELVGILIMQYHIRSILDVGCGEGFFVGEVYSKHIALPGMFLALVEPHAKLLEALITRIDGVYAVRAKGEAIPFSKNMFDLVVLWGVLDHIQNILEAFSEIVRVLKPGGRVLILTNNFWRHRTYEVPDDSGHWHAFSARFLHKLVEQAGLEVEGTWGNGFPAQIVMDRHGPWPGRLEKLLRHLPRYAGDFLNIYGMGDHWCVLNPYAPALINGGFWARLANMLGRLCPSRAFDHILVAAKKAA